VNRQIKQAHRHLDELFARMAENEGESAGGQSSEQRDVTILRSLPGVGRIVLATLLTEASEPLRRRDYHALRPLSGVASVTLPRQALYRDHAPGLPYAVAPRRLPLGARCHPARPA
jgi:hypothetical protein